MARTFPADFQAQTAQASSRPYLVLQIDWHGEPGTKYYLDRPATSFSSAGQRVPDSGLSGAMVVEWGQIALTLREMQVGSVDELTIKLHDGGGELTADLEAVLQQRAEVTIWRMFDHPDVTWPADAAKIFVGSLKPFAWTESERVVSLPLEDISRRLFRTVEFPARKRVFPKIDPDHEDRNIPLCWGRAQRVEAVLVERPWETRILQPVPMTASLPVDLDVLDHPSEIGAPVNFSVSAWLGNDRVTGMFLESSAPDTVPSVFRILSWVQTTKAQAAIVGVFGFGDSRKVVISLASVFPVSERTTLHDFVPQNGTVQLSIGGAWVTTTLDGGIATGDPAPGFASFRLNALMDLVRPGSAIRFANPSATRRSWQAGSVLRAIEGDWVYACNALPSYQVVKVEGFGSLVDDNGETRKDFILLGGKVFDTTDGTVEVTDYAETPYEVNLNDSTWSDPDFPAEGQFEQLEHNITTVRFSQAPRSIEPALDDNRIWVTLDGVETTGSGGETEDSQPITNPAAILSEYLENPYLFDVAEYVHEASFTAAGVALAQRRCGFAQLEPADGLVLLQDISRQCKSVLFFDQGQVQMKVLSNSNPGAVLHLTQQDVLEHALEIEEQPVEEVVTRLMAKWRYQWDDKFRPRSVLGMNAEAEAIFGVGGRDFDIWLYARRTYVESEVAFWLERWSRLYRTVKFQAFHRALRLQPGDWITLSYMLGQEVYATDLELVTTSRVASDSYTFTGQDIGRTLHIYSGTGFTPGSYEITAVDGGQADLSADAGTQGAAGGSFAVGSRGLYIQQPCEVLAVKDNGPRGLVEIVCRHSRALSAPE